MHPQRPLEGVRVLEIASIIFGPMAGPCLSLAAFNMNEHPWGTSSSRPWRQARPTAQRAGQALCSSTDGRTL
jgi:crotonobetainyl-CoA:carnitine CoA-transferase CaiB-like acyl-CoA transferase